MSLERYMTADEVADRYAQSGRPEALIDLIGRLNPAAIALGIKNCPAYYELALKDMQDYIECLELQLDWLNACAGKSDING